ncbi:hypothetical protein CJ030_MR5G017085 [Morella rubra]|uniref:Uncharacterized protein n=1 Tax=Morella rubra TaxID=262757 RepID=A0A6A1VLP4_9ROSI|nr:hypothetical protein CJ030_MR5G017085 [Morella rubra]
MLATLQAADAERITVEEESTRPKANRRLLTEGNKLFAGKVNAGGSEAKEPNANKVEAATNTGAKAGDNTSKTDAAELNPGYQYGNTPDSDPQVHRDFSCPDSGGYKAGGRCR